MPEADSSLRPRWSVMIPTFNCAAYLRETLESVLAQDPGPELMQIEVVDDVSTKDDPEAVVQEVGRGRVGFYRQPKNGGISKNFNTCIERAKGELIHILHGDDYVMPGFYEEVNTLAERHPKAGLLAARCFWVDEQSVIQSVTPQLKWLESGSGDPSPNFPGNLFQCAGVVVRSDAYKRRGFFREDMAHCADVEMWMRMISQETAVATSKVLGCYRFFPENDTSQRTRSGANVQELLRYSKVAVTYGPGMNLQVFRQYAHATALRQFLQFEAKGDRKSALANGRLVFNLANWFQKLRFLLLPLRHGKLKGLCIRWHAALTASFSKDIAG